MNLNTKFKNLDSIYQDIALPKPIETLNEWQLYLALINIVSEGSINKFLDIRNDLEKITRYMLLERFIKGDRKHPTIKKRDLDGNPISIAVDPDLLKYDGIDTQLKKLRKHPPKPLDIIKFYKGLENILLTKRNNISFENLELGWFTQLAWDIADSLTKKLYGISTLPTKERESAYTLLFSMIVIYRQFAVKAVPDISTLIDPYNGDSWERVDSIFTEESMSKFIRANFSKETLEKKICIKFYSGNASSPNTLSASTKILEDAWAVKNDIRLREAILKLSDHFIGGDQFKYFIETLFLNLMDMEDTIHSRLFSFTAPGGKSRIIACADWISQTALSGLHHYFFHLLGSLKSDCTFDHKAGIKKIYEEKKNFYSIDLSAATDRIPRILQARLIKVLMDEKGMDGKAISEGWLNIMDREYKSPSEKLNDGKPIRYSVGQGMGLFTSWSAMALLHHYIVWLIGVPISDYVLVGDDLLIKGDRSRYTKYIEIMSMIGVKVNQTKTIQSETERPTIEFARNYVIDGIYIVPAHFGILFAWQKEKASLDTLVYTSGWVDNKRSFLLFLVIFRNFISESTIGALMISQVKERHKFLNFDNLSLVFEIPAWLKAMNFKKIVELSKELDVNRKEGLILEDLSPISTLASQVVVRTTKELRSVLAVSQKLALLAFVDDEIAKVANKWHDRLSNVMLIKYDVDYFGSPLVTPRERKLLMKLIKREREREKETSITQ